MSDPKLTAIDGQKEEPFHWRLVSQAFGVLIWAAVATAILAAFVGLALAIRALVGLL